MKTRSRLLVLTVVAALLGLGAWLLDGGPEEPTPPAGEITDRPGDPVLAPPVLHGREREPLREPEPAVPDTPPQGIALAVRVLDKARGRALEGAEVRVAQGDDAPRMVRTDDAGVATIGNLRAGAIHVVARAPGFVRAEKPLILAGTEPAALELQLARGVRLEGTVVDARTEIGSLAECRRESEPDLNHGADSVGARGL